MVLILNSSSLNGPCISDLAPGAIVIEEREGEDIVISENKRECTKRLLIFTENIQYDVLGCT